MSNTVSGNDDFLSLVLGGSVATIEINRPAAKNAFSRHMWMQLASFVTQASADDDCKLLCLKSRVPGVFSAGADLKELRAGAQDAHLASANAEAVRLGLRALETCELVTLSVIDGACIGGGMGLACACDLRVSSTASRFQLPPARLGVVYSLEDTRNLCETIGTARAKAMLMTGQTVLPAQAKHDGFVMDVFAAETFDDSVADLCAGIASQSGSALRAIKANFGRLRSGQGGRASWRAHVAGFNSADFQSAIGIAAKP